MNGLLEIKLNQLWLDENKTSYQKKTLATTIIMTDGVTTLKEAKKILTNWLAKK